MYITKATQPLEKYLTAINQRANNSYYIISHTFYEYLNVVTQNCTITNICNAHAPNYMQ